MCQLQETPAVGAVRGSEIHIAAASGDASENAPTSRHRQDRDDGLRILRLHWGLDSTDLPRAEGRR
jgi:hypothetical protein